MASHANGMQPLKADANGGMFLWLPLFGQSDYDMIMGFTSSTVGQIGGGMTEYMSHAGTPAIQEQLFEVIDRCASGVVASERIHIGTPLGNVADQIPDGIADLYQCKLNPRHDMKDVTEWNEDWVEALPEMGEAAQNYSASMRTPVLGRTGEVDYVFAGVTPSMTDYTNAYQGYVTSEVGAKLQGRADKMATCRDTSWTGYWLIVPEGLR